MVWQLLFVFIKLRKVCLRNCYTTQGIRFAIGVTIYLCWTKGKGRPHISFVRFCDLLFVKNSCRRPRQCLKIQMSHSVYTAFPKKSRKKNSTKLIDCVHVTSRQPCWRSKQRNSGHVGGVKYSFGDWTLFLCKFLLLFHYANMASGHMNEHNLCD